MISFRFPTLFALLLAFVALPLAGCDSSDDDDGGGDSIDCPNAASGTFTAQAGGTSFDAVCIQANFDSGVFFIAGIVNLGDGGASQRQINISVPSASVGQRQLGLISGITVTYADVSPSGQDVFLAMSGTLNITTLSDSGASGTFSFEGANQTMSSTISVTNGSFDVTF
ncbi:MAG: DUF6252 family protein [Bacteroidota bacterium]